MNKHILLIIDHQLNPGKYSKKQLRQNATIAAVIYAEYAIGAGYVDYAAANAAAACAAADIAAIEHWIDRYFNNSKESKQDYINEINRGKK